MRRLLEGEPVGGEPRRERGIARKLWNEDVVIGLRNSIDDVTTSRRREQMRDRAERPRLAVDEIRHRLSRKIVVVREHPAVAVGAERRDHRSASRTLSIAERADVVRGE